MMCNNAPMHWDDWQVFLALARAGRATGAARRLGVEHTTVSRRLAALEKALGVPLFYRSRDGYRLTPHGVRAVPHAERMEQEALAIGARAREDLDTVAGRVRIAMAPEFASHWLVPRLGALRDRHPRLEPQILVGTRQRDLMRGEAELAVQAPRPRQHGVVVTRIGHVRLVLFGSRDHLPGRGFRVHDAASLRGQPLLIYVPALTLLQHAKWFRPLLRSAAVALETNSTHALLAAARAGLGIAVLPRFVARGCPDLAAVSEPVAEHDVWVSIHPEFRRDPRIRATTDFLKDVATGPEGLS